jgi:hypothetical protein
VLRTVLGKERGFTAGLAIGIVVSLALTRSSRRCCLVSAHAIR